MTVSVVGRKTVEFRQRLVRQSLRRIRTSRVITLHRLLHGRMNHRIAQASVAGQWVVVLVVVVAVILMPVFAAVIGDVVVMCNVDVMRNNVGWRRGHGLLLRVGEDGGGGLRPQVEVARRFRQKDVWIVDRAGHYWTTNLKSEHTKSENLKESY